MLFVILLAALLSTGAIADVTGRQRFGKCYCISGTRVRVRNNPCSTMIGSVSTGQAFKSRGEERTRCGYSWYSFNFNGKVGWAAGKYLRACADSECSSDRGGRLSSTSNSCAPMGTKLTHREAWSICMRAGGFKIKSSRSGGIGCRDKGCTSLEQVRLNTIQGIVTFQRESGCRISITGGTEKGHSMRGPCNHYNGYKLDISLSHCVYNYITRNYYKMGNRSDGASQYKDRAGNVYAKEGNHWDILFRN